MRKMAISLSLIIVSIFIILYSCTKTSLPGQHSVQDKSAQQKARKANEGAQKISETVNCNCPENWGSCVADCFFSTCCICFDPSVSEAACSCFFGISRCASGPKGQARLANTQFLTNDAAVRRNITIYPKRIKDMFGYLRNQGLGTARLESALNELESSSTPDLVRGTAHVIENEKYIDLFNEYVKFVESLDDVTKNKINQYINARQNEVNNQ